jgi:hypothetical protein
MCAPHCAAERADLPARKACRLAWCSCRGEPHPPGAGARAWQWPARRSRPPRDAWAERRHLSRARWPGPPALHSPATAPPGPGLATAASAQRPDLPRLRPPFPLAHRDRRSETPIPVVALVGYTNAGKSTLLNTLTSAGVLAEDKLFATLDPTTRRVRLRGNKEVGGAARSSQAAALLWRGLPIALAGDGRRCRCSAAALLPSCSSAGGAPRGAWSTWAGVRVLAALHPHILTCSPPSPPLAGAVHRHGGLHPEATHAAGRGLQAGACPLRCRGRRCWCRLPPSWLAAAAWLHLLEQPAEGCTAGAPRPFVVAQPKLQPRSSASSCTNLDPPPPP